VQKKRSGGGRKKKPGVQIQPRPSFFRYFRDLDQDNIPSEMGQDEEDEYEEEEMDELERLQMYMEHDWDKANTLKELIVPRAVRWYTGEAIQMAEEDEEDEDSVIEGTGAIRIYQELIFLQGLTEEFKRNRETLLKQYCELDTAAMVMIWAHWTGHASKTSAQQTITAISESA
jgi:nucleosome assembly protein 1-like 1